MSFSIQVDHLSSRELNIENQKKREAKDREHKEYMEELAEVTRQMKEFGRVENAGHGRRARPSSERPQAAPAPAENRVRAKARSGGIDVEGIYRARARREPTLGEVVEEFQARSQNADHVEPPAAPAKTFGEIAARVYGPKAAPAPAQSRVRAKARSGGGIDVEGIYRARAPEPTLGEVIEEFQSRSQNGFRVDHVEPRAAPAKTFGEIAASVYSPSGRASTLIGSSARGGR